MTSVTLTAEARESSACVRDYGHIFLLARRCILADPSLSDVEGYADYLPTVTGRPLDQT